MAVIHYKQCTIYLEGLKIYSRVRQLFIRTPTNESLQSLPWVFRRRTGVIWCSNSYLHDLKISFRRERRFVYISISSINENRIILFCIFIYTYTEEIKRLRRQSEAQELKIEELTAAAEDISNDDQFRSKVDAQQEEIKSLKKQVGVLRRQCTLL